MVFAALFGSYLYGRGIDPGLFARSQDTLNRNFGAANTLVLLASSLLVVLAWRAVGSPTYRHLAPRLLLSAVACGVGFVAIKVCEYHEKLAAGVSPTTNA